MKFRYTYDLAFDLVDFSCDEDFKFKRSVMVDEGIFLDFDENGMPVALEIIGASKIFHVHRKQLLEPDFKVHVEVTRELIKTEIRLTHFIDRRKYEVNVQNEIPNEHLQPAVDVVITK